LTILECDLGFSYGITDENWSISGSIVFAALLLWVLQQQQQQQVSISHEGCH
jgi:hypothetical protein